MVHARLFQWAVVLGASKALACPVCGTSSEQGQGAYVVMTGVMSLLPLALLGGVVAWVFFRVRRAERQQAAERARPSHAPLASNGRRHP